MRIGSLFSGYGGLDMAAEAAFDATTSWVADIDKGACKVLAHRFPDAPNLGDITATDWSAVEPVDIITGGSPCQDLSHAGRRAGMTDGTRSNLWVAMREAIAQIRPNYVIWENVRGAYSAAADSAVESCPGCVGDGSSLHLRALGRVLGDLSDLGYDCQWRGLRAADVGAPHGRFRVFVVARLADADDDAAGHRLEVARAGRRASEPAQHGRRTAADTPSDGRHEGRTESARLVRRLDAAERGGVSALSYLDRVESMTADPVLLKRVAKERDRLLPSSRTSDTNGAGQHGDGGMDLRTAVTLLPTPAVNDMGKAYTPEQWDEWTAKMQAAHGNGNGHGKSLEIEAARLLPTPVVTDAKGARNSTSGRHADSEHHSGDTLGDLVHAQRFGQYADAITRWESTTGLPAPSPTEPTGRGGAHRLSPRFTEWMMGLPAGWITDVPSVTRNEALKLCGNGVVQHQAFAAICDALNAWAEVAA